VKVEDVEVEDVEAVEVGTDTRTVRLAALDLS